MDSEAANIYSGFRDYVKTANHGIADKLSDILADFFSFTLNLKERDKAVKSSLTRRFRKLSRKYNVNNPEYPRTLDDLVK